MEHSLGMVGFPDTILKLAQQKLRSQESLVENGGGRLLSLERALNFIPYGSMRLTLSLG